MDRLSLIIGTVLLCLIGIVIFSSFNKDEPEGKERKGKMIIMNPLILQGPVKEVFWAITTSNDTIILPLQVDCPIDPYLKKVNDEF